MVHIVDKIKAAVAAETPFFSFEYFPPRTEEVRNGGARESAAAARAHWRRSRRSR